MHESIISPSDRDLHEARAIFREMLARQEKEQKWQDFFAKHPFVLSRSLPLRLEPNEIIPLGRRGKTEADFIFYQRFHNAISSCGVIELKRPDQKVLKSPRKQVIQLTDTAQTAIRQARRYSKTIERPDKVLFLGNPVQLFVIMGMSDEFASRTVEMIFEEDLLPPNCRILPYDFVLKQFETTIPKSIIVLVPDRSLLYPREIEIELPGLLSGVTPLTMVLIPSGEFMMGSPKSEDGRWDDEGPRHRVVIKDEFYIGKCPVTQAQWRVVMGENPSLFENQPNNPVENVKWNDCQKFIEKLNQLGQGIFRLPSEAEWEYTCRAGTATRFYWGDDPDEKEIGEYAWFQDNSSSKTHPVGEKKPNDFGLYDMSGNVHEWCEDDRHKNYKGKPSDGNAWVENPRTPYRVLRGGCLSDFPGKCRSANRNGFGPAYRLNIIGFRVVFSRTL